jgi:hypothetical protein
MKAAGLVAAVAGVAVACRCYPADPSTPPPVDRVCRLCFEPRGGVTAYVMVHNDERADAFPLLVQNLARLAPRVFSTVHVVMVHPRMYTARMARIETVLPVTRVVEERSTTAHSYIARLAAARNTYLSRVGTTDKTPYTLVVDSDMCLPWDVDGIADAVYDLAAQSDWAAVCANGVGAPNTCTDGEYQDLLALQPPHTTSIYRLAPNAPPVVVESAFGGFAIYKSDALRRCRHTAGADHCEHWSLNGCLRNHTYTVVIHPAMVVHWPAHRYCWDKTHAHIDRKLGPSLPDTCRRAWQ